ncbi:class I adenylate-forming enzyme family protein [Nocardia cyriacigeorgica]|uniref:class I adenylate-forming enzyme family protein n=1 Tax=Nocardia cyriacigeorgica TaxID=135487 RepID=UPI002457F37C|nr:class I adenylate-forming enzyme family protein [Nocardia cyriacigeorgica]
MTISHAPTLAGRMASHARNRGRSRAVSAPAGTQTYAEFAGDVARIADRLHAAGLRRGDRIAVLAHNDLAYVQLVYAASWAGIALVGLNWGLTVTELRAVLDDCNPSLLFAEPESASGLDASCPVILLDGSEFEHWYAAGDSGYAPDGEQSDESVVLLAYTTGTTGEPKGIQLVERNLREMSQQAAVAWALHPDIRYMACLPLFRMSGMSSVICCVHVGGEVVIPSGDAITDIAGAIEGRGVTHTSLVPTQLTGLVAEKAADAFDLSTLELIVYGSAPSNSSLVEEAMEMLPQTGFSQGYGLTETCAGVAIAPTLRRGEVDRHPGSVGRILPNCECRIVEVSTNRDVGAGTDGEIWLRTPQLTIGYWNKPAETAAAISADGWFRTGDIGSIDDDGFLYVRDRLKDMIIVGGENVYSIEVENAIGAHPAVREAAVVGVPHPQWGEAVKAVVVLGRGHELDETELFGWLEGRLAHHKHPRIIEFVTDLPRAGSGEILKRELR